MTPDDIEKDKVICEAATQGEWWREDVFVLCFDGKSPFNGRGHHQEILNAAAAVNAVNRLPLYIAEAEEMQRRIAEVETLADGYENKAREWRERKEIQAAFLFEDKALAVRAVLRLLRGEK